MGFFVVATSAILEEHKHRPITGRCLMIGRQNTGLKAEDVEGLLRQHGIEQRTSEFETDPTTFHKLHRTDGPFVMDRSFFAAFSDCKVEAIDVSEYEGAEIIHDLSTPIPDPLKGQFDFLYDGSTLDNIFDVSTAMKNMHNLLKPGGRMVLMNWSHSFHQAYNLLSPDWYMDFFAINKYRDAKVYVFEYDPPYSRIWQYDPLVTAGDDYVYLPSAITARTTRAIICVAEKSDDPTDPVAPVPAEFRGNSAPIYLDSAKRFHASSRKPYGFAEFGSKSDRPSISATGTLKLLTDSDTEYALKNELYQRERTLGEVAATVALQEHRFKPLAGAGLLLGCDHGRDDPAQVDALLARHEVGRTRPTQAPQTARAGRPVSGFDWLGQGFFEAFSTLSCAHLDSASDDPVDPGTDRSSPDLAQAAGQYDFLFDCSTLDDTFDVARAMKNMHDMLKPGGRMILMNWSHSVQRAYGLMPADWYMDFFTANGYADAKVYVYENDPPDTRIWHYQPMVLGQDPTKDPMEYQVPAVTAQSSQAVICIAEKGAEDSTPVSPVQRWYRGTGGGRGYEEAAERFMASPRGIFSFEHFGEANTRPSISMFNTLHLLSDSDVEFFDPETRNVRERIGTAIAEGRILSGIERRILPYMPFAKPKKQDANTDEES